MEETLLLTVQHAAQADDDLFVSPPIPADQYDYDLNGMQAVKVVLPDGRAIEKMAEFFISLGTRTRSYTLRFPSTRESEVPPGSQI
jgi:hypothetical protein